MAELLSSQIVLIAAAFEGLALTTLAILRDIDTRRLEPQPGGAARAKP